MLDRNNYVFFVFLSTPSGWRATRRRRAFARRGLHFYPRPPGGGRPATVFRTSKGQSISIHALRVEGDSPPPQNGGSRKHFYPRPPGGGRLALPVNIRIRLQFLSTPSGWRATAVSGEGIKNWKNFYPRPPGGGRLVRAEAVAPLSEFLSTPSGWRATCCILLLSVRFCISIHALRVEGDLQVIRVSPAGKVDFYPRPPGGGRRRSPTCGSKED